MKNHKAHTTVKANKGRNHSCIYAISASGLVGYEIQSSPYDSESFIRFIENKILSAFENSPNKILIMDNVRFHKSRQVLEYRP